MNIETDIIARYVEALFPQLGSGNALVCTDGKTLQTIGATGIIDCLNISSGIL